MSEKLLEQYIIKIPITLKHNLSKLTDIEIKAMTADARMLMAKHCHNSAAFFNPKIYLDEEESK